MTIQNLQLNMIGNQLFADTEAGIIKPDEETTCPDCDGAGVPTYHESGTCLRCKGSGVVREPKADPDCEHCDGTGIVCVPNGPDDYDKEPCSCLEESD